MNDTAGRELLQYFFAKIHKKEIIICFIETFFSFLRINNVKSDMNTQNFRNLGELIKFLKLQYRQKMKLEDVGLQPSCPEKLKEEIAFVLQEAAYDISTQAICENLVYPVLRESWRFFSDLLSLWGNPKIDTAESEISPNYVFTKRSDFGKIVMETPYLCIVEVSTEHRNVGWMHTLWKMQEIRNQNPELRITVYGIMTNGETWEIGKLEQNVFTQYTQRYDIGDLDRLFQGICSVLTLCKKQTSLTFTSENNNGVVKVN